MASRNLCNHIALTASYNWHSLEDAVDDAVAKAASDIVSGRNIWSLNSYRSFISFRGLELDNLKFVHPFIVTDKKTGEQLRIPEIVFQELAAGDSGCDTVIIGNQDVVTITSMVKNCFPEMFLVASLEAKQTKPSLTRKKAFELHKKYFNLTEHDPVFIAAGDLPFFYNMFVPCVDTRLKDTDWLYSINAETAVWKDIKPFFSRNYYWPLCYEADRKKIITKIKEGNWEIENERALMRTAPLVDILYGSRKGGEATRSMASIILKKIFNHPLEVSYLSGKTGLDFLFTALLQKKIPLKLQDYELLMHILTNSGFGQYTSKITCGIVLNNDPFAVKDYDALNQDYTFYAGLLQAVVDKYGMKEGLAQVTPFPEKLRKIGHIFAEQDEIPLIRYFPEIITDFISKVNKKFEHFPDPLGEHYRKKFETLDEHILESIRNARLEEFFDNDVFIGYDEQDSNIERAVQYLSSTYLPKYFKDKHEFVKNNLSF